MNELLIEKKRMHYYYINIYQEECVKIRENINNIIKNVQYTVKSYLDTLSLIIFLNVGSAFI